MTTGVPGGIMDSWARSASCSRMQPCEMAAPVVPISESSYDGDRPVDADDGVAGVLPVGDGVGVVGGRQHEGPVRGSGGGTVANMKY